MPALARERLPAAERRTRIRAAALEIFAANGYDRASIREIAAQAGITPPILYDHFGSKKDLYLELLEEEASELLRRVTRLPQSDQPAQYMRQPIDAFFAFVEQHRFAWRMLFRDPPVDPETAAAHRAIQQRATSTIAELFALTPQWRVTPSLSRQTAIELLAEVTKSALNGLAAWWWDNPTVTRSQLVDLAMDALWTGMRHLRGEEGA